MTDFIKTKKNNINRLPKRGYYDRETIYSILDEALICHVGFAVDGQPYVIPTNFARLGDRIVLHGAKASRLLKHVEAGHLVCLEATIVDGLVLARSVFHHSMNYRSVVIFGTGHLVENEQEKLRALEAVTEHLVPGRWKEARLPSRKELNATTVVSIKIDEASAKVRVGPPLDEARITHCPSGQECCRCKKHRSLPFRMSGRLKISPSRNTFQDTHGRAVDPSSGVLQYNR